MMNKNIKCLIASIIYMIITIIISVGCIVYATGFGSELENISDTVSGTRYNEGFDPGTYTVEASYSFNKGGTISTQALIDELNGEYTDLTTRDEAESNFEGKISNYSNVFCLKHTKGIQIGRASCRERVCEYG